MRIKMSYLNIENLEKTYGKEKVIKGFNLQLEQGELAVIVGASGCGKTTLMRILVGLEYADSGKILLNGKDISDLKPGQREIGMIFQKYSLFPNMTVRENIAYGLRVKKCPNKEIFEKTDEMLEMIHLTEKADAWPSTLSGGQQQRVAFARAMIVRPQILLLDEPFSALDTELKKELRGEIKRIQRETGLTAIFVTHDREEAMVLADRLFIMHDGTIEQCGKPWDVYNNPKTLYAASFIGDCNIIPADQFKEAAGFSPEAGYAVIRNEKILLKEKGDSDPEAVLIPVTVSDAEFCGKTVKYTLSSASGMILKAEMPSQEDIHFQKGDHATVEIKKENVIGLDR